MSVNSINFSTVGAAPLKANKNVSFAGQGAQESKKSNTGKYVAVGLTLAAVTAAVVFRKDISKLIGKLPPSIKDPIMNAGKKVSDLATNAWNAIKSKFKPATTTSAGVATGVSSWASKAWNGIVTAGKTVGKWAQTAWTVTKDFCVNMFKKFMGLFAKPTVPPAV